MGTWFLNHGCKVVRLGLPQWDLRRQDCAGKVVRMIVEDIRNGYTAVVWSSLPCTAWSTWQNVNAALSEAGRLRVEQERQESLRMMKVL